MEPRVSLITLGVDGWSGRANLDEHAVAKERITRNLSGA
jgi:hypothetical protein